MGILLVVDECFNDFLEYPEQHTLKGAVREGGTLILLKAFTKSFAMPGLRLGYCLCGDSQLAEQLSIPNLVLWHTEDKNLSQRKWLYTEEGTEFYSGRLIVPDDREIIPL